MELNWARIEDGEWRMEDGVFVLSSILNLPFSLERT
jgi:hypothetical protein